MSGRHPKMSGWVGYGDGQEILVRADQPLDDDHQVVVERPELFHLPEAPVETQPGCTHPNCVLDHPHAGPAVLSVPEQTAVPGEALPPVPEAAYPPGAQPLEVAPAPDGYDGMKLTELREVLAGRQLTISGNKPELVARLRAADAAAVAGG